MKKLSLIIPVYNEAKTVCQLLDTVYFLDLSSVGYTKEIIIVNDGSTDGSHEAIQLWIDKIWKNADIHYIRHIHNKGKWHACKEGFGHAHGDWMIIQDSDLEYNPEDYKEMIFVAEKKNLNVVYGSRILGMKKFRNTYSSQSFLWWWLLVSFFTTLLTWVKVTDEPTCYKMFDKTVKPYLLLPEENGFAYEPAITMLVLRKHLRYGEVPIHYKARKITDGKKIKWKDGLEALWTLFIWRFKKI